MEGVTLCPHLAPVLQTLLDSGGQIVSLSRGAWSAIDLDVMIDLGPGADVLAPDLAPGVKPWSNRDTHYPLEQGVTCSSCRHSLSWPQG